MTNILENFETRQKEAFIHRTSFDKLLNLEFADSIGELIIKLSAL
jgi:hypothetical protein